MSETVDKLWKFLGDEPDTLVRMLLRAEKHLTKRSLEEMRASGADAFTESQLQVIRQLCFGHARTTEIAESLGISKQAVSQLLSPLVENGLIEQASDEADGRAKINRLTQKGSDLFDTLLIQTMKMEQKVRDQLGREKVAEVKSALAAILET